MVRWAVALVFGATLLEWALLAWRVRWWFTASLPLALEPLPVPRLPEGEGRTATVAWEARGDEVLFVAAGGLPGLHGLVSFVPDRTGFRLDVRWAPPWTLVVLCGSLGWVGAVYDVGAVAITASVVALAGILMLYQQAAVRAAAELRWAWVRDEGD